MFNFNKLVNKNKTTRLLGIFEEAILLLIIFFLPIIFDFFGKNYNIFDLEKVVFFRVFLMVALILRLARIFVKKRSVAPLNRILLILLFVFGASLSISTFFSIHPQLSFYGSNMRQQGLYSFLSYLLFFLLLFSDLQELNSSKESINPKVKRIILAVVIPSFFVCLYGLMQLVGLDPINWKDKIADTRRIYSSLGQPNFFGQYLIMVIPLSIYSLAFIAKRFFSRSLVFFLILIQITALILTYSRSAWLGFIASAGFFVFLVLLSRGLRKTAWGLALLSVVAGCIIIFNVIATSTSVAIATDQKLNFSNRLQSTFKLEGGSNKMRVYYWQAASREFVQASWVRKLIGYGPETLSDIYVKYYARDWAVHEKVNSIPDRSHNAPVDIILQFGVLGLLATCLFLGYIFFSSFKYLKKNRNLNHESWLVIFIIAILVGYFINNLFSFSLTVGYAYFYLLLAILGVISIGSPKDTSELGQRAFFNPASKVLIFTTAIFVCGIFFYYYNFNVWRADSYYLKARRAEAKRDCVGLLDNMEKVVNLDPNNVFYKEQYIFYNASCIEAVESRQSRKDLYANAESMRATIKPKDYGFYTRLNIAHAETIFGFYIDNEEYKKAEKDFQDIIAINPFFTTSYQDLGRLKLWQKDFPAAIDYFKSWERALPSLNNPGINEDHKKEVRIELIKLYELMGLTYDLLGNDKEAVGYYSRALELDPFYVPLYKKIADVYYKKGDLDKAIWYNKRGYMLNPRDYNWPFALSLLYKEIGDKHLALEYAGNALSLAPDNSSLKNFVTDLRR